MATTQRPWGEYEVVYTSSTVQVKIITVLPYSRLSYQTHERRAEQWTIIEGEGIVTLGNTVYPVRPDDTVTVHQGVAHRIENIGSAPLVFVEIQTGTYFGEDDIVRLEDDFGRAE